MVSTLKKTRKGAAMVEYAVLLGAITLVALIAVSMLGNKTTDIISTLAVILPGANPEDDLSLRSGALVEFNESTDYPSFAVFNPAVTGAVDGVPTYRLAHNVSIDEADMDLLVSYIPVP